MFAGMIKHSWCYLFGGRLMRFSSVEILRFWLSWTCCFASGSGFFSCYGFSKCLLSSVFIPFIATRVWELTILCSRRRSAYQVKYLIQWSFLICGWNSISIFLCRIFLSVKVCRTYYKRYIDSDSILKSLSAFFFYPYLLPRYKSEYRPKGSHK